MSQSQRIDMVLLAHIRDQFELSGNSYGRPRMTEELKELGLEVGHRRVGRLMRQNNISVIRTRKHKVTTDSNHKFNFAHMIIKNDCVNWVLKYLCQERVIVIPKDRGRL